MPTYQVTYQSADLMSIRNRFGLTIGDVIDKTIKEEQRDWDGEIEYIELVEVKLA